MKKLFVGLFAMVPSLAFAVDPTIADITLVITAGTLITALVAVGVTIAGFKLVKQGAIVVLSFLGKLR